MTEDEREKLKRDPSTFAKVLTAKDFEVIRLWAKLGLPKVRREFLTNYEAKT